MALDQKPVPVGRGSLGQENARPRKEITRLARRTINIGTWNIRTLKEIGKLHILTSEMERLNCEIIGLTEIRWQGNGHFSTKNEFTMYYSGSSDERSRGVGLVLSKRL